MPAADLFRRLLGSKTRAGPRPPVGRTVYAVGDIHGRADLLKPTLGAILEDCGAVSERALLVFIGDYVDRGEDSRGVIDQLIQTGLDGRVEARFLRGNHDAALLDFLANPATGPTWCSYGGRETLQSYRVAPPWGSNPDAWIETALAFSKALPPSHRAFFESLELSLEAGDYFFAHAGIRPGIALDAQEEHDLIWIRQPFLDDPRRLPKVVVHGHTPTEAVYADARRIGIDTGAYATNLLTTLRLRGDTRVLLQTVWTPGQGWCVETRPLTVDGERARV